MDVGESPVVKNLNKLSITAKIVIFLVFLLVRIGDLVRYPIRHVKTGINKSYNYLSHLRFPRLHYSFPPLPKLPSLPSLPQLQKRHVSQDARQQQAGPPPTDQPPALRVLRFSDQLKLFFAGVTVTLLCIVLPISAYSWLKALPHPTLLSRRDIEVTTKIFDRNDILLYEIYADQNRTPLPLGEIPDHVRQATIAIEDRDFYHHQGFSPRGVIRAAREIFFNNRVQGGSTITQQLIKSALLTPEITLTRKVKELTLAIWAELIYSKDEILEMYLNQVPYGGTAWGIEAAAQTYFGKSITQVTLAEAALLAGLPAAPTSYSPFGSAPQKAVERQREVLRRMVEDGYISAETADAASNETLTYTTPHTSIRAPHFVLYVKELLEKKYGARLVERGGLRITTSLDAQLQDAVQSIVTSRISELARLRVGNGAALVTDPNTGEILAMVGSRNYFDLTRDGNVNVTTTLQQPGSSIKVVTYAAALEKNMTAATLLEDTPVVYNTPGSPPYAPVNYDGIFHGIVPFRYALGNSYNIPAVKLLARIGIPTFLDYGRAMGISSWDQRDEGDYGLSLTLGGAEVTMLEMAQVFGTLANEGIHIPLLPVLEVVDYKGSVIERNKPKNGGRAVSEETAWIMGHILSDNTARTSAFGPNSTLVIPGKTVSVKTGTSNDKRDNWTIGYTPSVVATVWVGNNDNSPMDPFLTSGVTGAAPIWHDIMETLLLEKSDETTPQPKDVVSVPCYMGRPEYFIKGTEPKSGRCAPIPTQAPTPTTTP